eukprot:8768597-Pyramimonas_sp.AAC.1
MDPIEDQQELRELLQEHSCALESIFKYYVDLDLNAFTTDGDSAIDEDMQEAMAADATFADSTNLVQSMNEHGRLHTRQVRTPGLV